MRCRKSRSKEEVLTITLAAQIEEEQEEEERRCRGPEQMEVQEGKEVQEKVLITSCCTFYGRWKTGRRCRRRNSRRCRKRRSNSRRERRWRRGAA